MTTSFLSLPVNAASRGKSELESYLGVSFDATKALRPSDMAVGGNTQTHRTLSLDSQTVYQLHQTFLGLSPEHQREIERSLSPVTRAELQSSLSDSVGRLTSEFFNGSLSVEQPTRISSSDASQQRTHEQIESTASFNTEERATHSSVTHFNHTGLESESMSESVTRFRAAKLELENNFADELQRQTEEKMVYENKLESMKEYLKTYAHSMRTYSDLKQKLEFNYMLLNFYTVAKKDSDVNKLAQAVNPLRVDKFEKESQEYADLITKTKTELSDLHKQVNKKVKDWIPKREAYFAAQAKEQQKKQKQGTKELKQTKQRATSSSSPQTTIADSDSDSRRKVVNKRVRGAYDAPTMPPPPPPPLSPSATINQVKFARERHSEEQYASLVFGSSKTVDPTSSVDYESMKPLPQSDEEGKSLNFDSAGYVDPTVFNEEQDEKVHSEFLATIEDFAALDVTQGLIGKNNPFNKRKVNEHTYQNSDFVSIRDRELAATEDSVTLSKVPADSTFLKSESLASTVYENLEPNPAAQELPNPNRSLIEFETDGISSLSFRQPPKDEVAARSAVFSLRMTSDRVVDSSQNELADSVPSKINIQEQPFTSSLVAPKMMPREPVSVVTPPPAQVNHSASLLNLPKSEIQQSTSEVERSSVPLPEPKIEETGIEMVGGTQSAPIESNSATVDLLVNALRERNINDVKELAAFKQEKVTVKYTHNEIEQESDWLAIDKPNFDAAAALRELDSFDEKTTADLDTANALFEQQTIQYQAKKHGIQDEVFGGLEDSSSPLHKALKNNNYEIANHLIKSEAEARDTSPFYIVVKRKLSGWISRLFSFAFSNSRQVSHTENTEDAKPFTVTSGDINEQDIKGDTPLTLLIDNKKHAIFNGIVSKGDSGRLWLSDTHKQMLKNKLDERIRDEKEKCKPQWRDAVGYLGVCLD
ncbi:hypothetical protein JQC92_05415 [Shewanella sp. 202IG2-18]|uniref:hypothetical protein n=1 Tax=Parashewanella hymeniacidonis TaxID=2807618 RepID=UPI0019608A5E|nr:hypothetical protein [Parashewanella hymeniacidonis]MBM7071476.1 hypothetical protein [Parashewanella hymeniacidonis]